MSFNIKVGIADCVKLALKFNNTVESPRVKEQQISRELRPLNFAYF